MFLFQSQMMSVCVCACAPMRAPRCLCICACVSGWKCAWCVCVRMCVESVIVAYGTNGSSDFSTTVSTPSHCLLDDHIRKYILHRSMELGFCGKLRCFELRCCLRWICKCVCCVQGWVDYFLNVTSYLSKIVIRNVTFGLHKLLRESWPQ